MSEEQIFKKVAFFDFDGTLAESDSLWPFLCRVRGTGFCLFAAFYAGLARFHAQKDARTVFKRELLSRTLSGLPVAAVQDAVQEMKTWPRWIEASCQSLREHHALGHKIVIASGSLDLYLSAMLDAAKIPYDDIICTKMEVSDGIITGKMIGGNCVRKAKARRIVEYMGAEGPFAESWAYGNAPHDLPMMALTNHKTVI